MNGDQQFGLSLLSCCFKTNCKLFIFYVCVFEKKKFVGKKMRLSIHQFWNQHKKRQTPNNVNSNVIKNLKKDQPLWRDILAYWILGLCTEFGYVVIISAAHDILHRFKAPKVCMPNGDVFIFVNNKIMFLIHFKISMFRMMNLY